MRLYKCIPFSKRYWAYVANKHVLRFSKICELWNGNDRTEFNHVWHGEESVSNLFRVHLKPIYDELVVRNGILCLSKIPSQRLWNEYCKDGGVRYEFEFTPSMATGMSVTFKDVVYDDNKTFRLLEFLAREVSDQELKRILISRARPSPSDRAILKSFLMDPKYKDLRHRHFTEELAFKKTTQYRYEKELRFAHPFFSGGPLKLLLKGQMAKLDELGLDLISIGTNNILATEAQVKDKSIKIKMIEFSDS